MDANGGRSRLLAFLISRLASAASRCCASSKYFLSFIIEKNISYLTLLKILDDVDEELLSRSCRLLAIKQTLFKTHWRTTPVSGLKYLVNLKFFQLQGYLAP